MPPGSLPAGLVTFCFTDVEGSTRLFHELGDRWPALLEEHNAIVRAATAAHGGAEVKTEGDAFFLAFPDAADALAACADMQRALAAHPWPTGGRIRVRMALHTAEAAPVGDDYVSIAVHRVARIVGAAHGGQVLTSAETAAAASDRLGLLSVRELGAYTLKDFDMPQRLFQLTGPGLGDEFPQLRVPPASRHNLPRQRTTFVGREEQLVALTALVTTSPLLTMVAVGGAGKTRTAIEVAQRLVPAHDDGVWFVDLAALTQPSLVPAAVASALGVVETPNVPIEQSVVEHLAERSALLILDNCEQVVDAVADLVDAILAGAPRVRIISTSREALRVRGEQIWPLAPLTQPDGADQIATSESGRLFLERARLIRPAFTVDDPMLLSVLLRALDGIPLAIELAAARMATMTVTEVVTQLDRRLDLLAGGARHDAPRQRTLRAMVGWSHDLLTDDEKAVFARVSVFRSGFGRQSAYEVASYGGLDERTVESCLDSLVAKSLLEVADGRFRMLVTIQAYAQETLAPDREAADRHLAWVLGLLDLSALAAGTAAHRDALDAVQLEHDNVRAAFTHARATGNTETLRVAAGAAEFRFLRGHVDEGRADLRTALAETGGADPTAVACALLALGRNQAQNDARGDEGRTMLTAALELFRAEGDLRGVAATLLTLAESTRLSLVTAEVTDLLREARSVAAEAGDAAGETMALIRLSYVLADQGDHDDALRAAAEAHERAVASGDRRSAGIALHSSSVAHWLRGEVEESRRDAADALAVFRLLGDLRSQVLVGIKLAEAATASGRSDDARQHLAICLRMCRELRLTLFLPEILRALAANEVRDGAAAAGEATALALGLARRDRPDLLPDIEELFAMAAPTVEEVVAAASNDALPEFDAVIDRALAITIPGSDAGHRQIDRD